MSFYASNNRIRVTKAGETVFDTAQPMPHIVERKYVSCSVTFPNAPSSYRIRSVNLGQTALCQRLEQQYSCEQQYVCGIDGCKWETVCGWKPVWVNDDLWQDIQGFNYSAVEWSTLVDLGAITGGIEADFILANCVASRTQQGTLIDVGAIPCGLPLGSWFMANNSSIIESGGDVGDGQPFLTRVMSLFVQNGHVYVEFKHSNRAFSSRSEWGATRCATYGVPPFIGDIPRSPPSAVSAYNFTFDLVVGKFTTPS